ncbi:MAG TPA: HU family DNA-binding protein [Gemmatimonadales bacterium]|nr:HU family DNA-binding protein [Gemmatimonadales bacterium]
MNKATLIGAVAERAGLSKAQAAGAVAALFGPNGVIATELRRGGKVLITGFGSFVARRRPARNGRDPRTGRVIQIPAALVPAFRVGEGLKGVVGKAGKKDR